MSFSIKHVVRDGKTYRFLILFVDDVEVTIGYLDRFNTLHTK